jgi:hypothetical protein
MYDESLGLSKADRLWRDALETAASSKEISVAEELAGYFVSIGNKDAFAAILYVCFELVRPDFVEEMVSRRGCFARGQRVRGTDDVGKRGLVGEVEGTVGGRAGKEEGQKGESGRVREQGVRDPSWRWTQGLGEFGGVGQVDDKAGGR